MPSFRDFYFNSSTGKNKIHCRMCSPDCAPRGIVQIIHGIAEHIERYEDFMTFLANNGLIAVGTDHLGHGKSVESNDQLGFFSETDGWDHVVDDEEILHQAMLKNYPDIPSIVFGHSMGSFMTRTLLIKYPESFDAAIISGTGNQSSILVFGGHTAASIVKLIMGPHHQSKLLDNLAFGSYNKIYDSVKTKFDWLSRDEEVAQKYIDDPMCGFLPTCTLFRDMMNGVKIITNTENLNNMDKDKPIYFMSGEMDPVGDCGKGVNIAYNNFLKAGMKDVSIKLYPEGRHEMLNELNKDEVYSDIINWINSKI